MTPKSEEQRKLIVEKIQKMSFLEESLNADKLYEDSEAVSHGGAGDGGDFWEEFELKVVNKESLLQGTRDTGNEGNKYMLTKENMSFIPPSDNLTGNLDDIRDGF